jgi:integrase
MSRGDMDSHDEKGAPQAVTLRAAYEKYISVRPLAAQTRQGYKYCIETCLSDWLDLPFTKITKDMVEERHRKLTQDPLRHSGRNGQARANVVMKTLKSILSFASERFAEDEEPLLRSNPVDRLTANKQWHRRVVKEGVIAPEKLCFWFDVVTKITNEVARDYLIFLLFTGMRRSEAAQLRWTFIDFETRIINVPAEITKTKRAYALPLSQFLSELLKSRSLDRSSSNWVFPSSRYPDRTIANVGHHLPALRNACGYEFCIHDTRRTFLTIGAKLQAPFHILKSLVNHKIGKDITDRYIITDMDTKRYWVEQITKELIRLSGANLTTLIGSRSRNQTENSGQLTILEPLD